MDVGGRATSGTVAERVGVRGIKRQILGFEPLILTFSQRKKGLLTLRPGLDIQLDEWATLVLLVVGHQQECPIDKRIELKREFRQ